MEKNVQQLLAAEREVNSMVQRALKDKRDKLGKIKQQVDLEVEKYKQELEAEKAQKIAQVSLNF